MAEIKDFTKQRTQLRFRIDEDVFEAAPAIPADVMIRFAGQFAVADPSQLTIQQQVGIFKDMLAMVLLPESMKIMERRMSDSENPVDMAQLDEIITWLFEEYGMRPTTESGSSANGVSPPGSGTSSTGSTPVGELISAASLSTAS